MVQGRRDAQRQQHDEERDGTSEDGAQAALRSRREEPLRYTVLHHRVRHLQPVIAELVIQLTFAWI